MANHKWTAHDLSLAYYVAKYGWYGISQDLEYWAYNVIGTTPRSLAMQIKKFKHIVNGKGKLTNASELQRTLLRHFSNKPMSYVRDRVEELRKGLKYGAL